MKKLNIAYQYGLVAAAITIAVYNISYLLNPEFMVGPATHWITLAAVVIIMAIACRKERDSTEKAYPYKQALSTAFRVFLVNTLLFTAFYYLLFAVIDPELVDLQNQVNLQYTKWLAKDIYGIDEYDQAYKDLESIDNSITFGGAVLGIARNIIGGFLIATVVALIYRREFSFEDVD